MEIKNTELQSVAMDSKELASYGEIARDCYGLDGASVASEIENRFPAVAWLLSTSMSQAMRTKVANDIMATRIGEDGKYMLQIPRSIWTLPAENKENECCWVPVEFDKCAGEVPINVLCLKDCNKIADMLMGQVTRVQSTVAPVAYAGETIEQINDRIARMSMAMYTAHTLIQGMNGVTTNTTKPFNGLMQVMSNPAVIHIDGSGILAAFDELACRMAVVGLNNPVFMAHPLIIEAIKRAIEPDQYNRRPAGWSISERGEVRFNGVRFIADKLIPFSTTTSTGDVWLVDGDTVGAMLITDLIPADRFRREGWSFDEESCGTECRYYYNAGAVFANNANKLAVITNVSIGDSCANGIADLAGLVVPQTLIPKA